MGVYLNSTSPYMLFKEEFSSAYYVDKSEILKELVLIVDTKDAAENTVNCGKNYKYVCITRPRRFGKTVMANMIASYFGREIDSGQIFRQLKISSYGWFEEHLNNHNVIHIMLNELPRNCKCYEEYIERIQNLLIDDLMMAYPSVRIRETDAVWDILKKIFEYCGGERFIFVLDEWDFIFHRDFVSDADKASYIDFLSNLLKDKPYVEMAYMTGILPIAKYSSGSELNMFFEFSMAGKVKYSEYFGFTDEEVDELYGRYQRLEREPKVTREGLKIWYDGYQTMPGRSLYNPRSVVGALSLNQLGNYWTSSGPYDEIYTYVKKNIADISFLMNGGYFLANVQEWNPASKELTTRDEIFSIMVAYGFLSYVKGNVSVPNREVRDTLWEMMRKC